MSQFPRIAAIGLVALLAAAPARANLGVGASTPIDPGKFPAVRAQDQVAAADNGTISLFVWRDARHGDSDVFGARVKHDGTVLDPNGIELAAGSGEQSEPAVAWDGTQWLVAWNDQGEIKAQRVGTSGALLDPAPIALSGAGATHPGVAWNGALHVVVWAEAAGNIVQVKGATLDVDGNVRAAAAVLSLGTSDVQPAIAAAGANALVAFRTSRSGNEDVYGFRVTAALPAGTITRLDVADVPLVAQTDPQEVPAVASNGTAWLVAWEDFRARVTNGGDIRGTRVSAAGAVLDAGTIAIAVGPGDDSKVGLTHDGSQWLATWTSSSDGQLLQRIANNGNPTGSTQVVSNDLPVAGDGAFGGAAASPLVAWSNPADGSTDLFGRAVGTPLGSPFVIAFQTPNQTEPAQAFGSGHWMIAWVDDRFGTGERQVRFGLTDSARFEAPNPATVAFAVPRAGLDQGHPALVFDGTNFNLFWDEERGGRRIVAGARFTAGGAPVDTFTVAGDAWNQYEPTADVVPNGDVVVAWTDARVGPTERDIWMAQLTGGVETGGRRAMANVVGTREEHPQVAVVQGEQAIIAYETSAPGQDRAVESSSTFLPIVSFGPFHGTVAKLAGRTFERPSIASNGEDALVAFQEVVFSDGPALNIPRAARYIGDGSFMQFFTQIAPGSYTPANPVIGSAGYDYVTLWSSRLAGTIDVNAAALDPVGNNDFDSTYALTSDLPADTPGSAEQGQPDRVGFTYMRSLSDTTWSGLQLYGGDARDTLSGAVVINEFLAHPANGGDEFIEYYDTSGRSFLLNGWKLRVNGVNNEVTQCFSDAPKVPDFAVPGGIEGNPCSFIGNQDFFTDESFNTWTTGDPVEGHLPDRGATLELLTPGGILVDAVGYGYKGGAPVSGAIPAAIAPAAQATPDQARIGQVAAPGDSVDLSTARIPNGTDTNNDANDFNLTNTTTPNNANTGTSAALGTALFVTRAYWNPSSGEEAVEFFNPSTSQTFDFAGWYLSNNSATERIGVNTNAFSQLRPQEKRVLRRGATGSFTFHMDELSVLYLMAPDLTRYEQLGWSRPDQVAPDMCVTRSPDTGGFHDGFDWFTCGGVDNISAGELRYTTCTISNPTTDVPAPVSFLSFAGAIPNPSRASQAPVLAFSIPGAPGGSRVHARLALYDVAGRRVATLVDTDLAPGPQRVPLARVDEARRVLRAGTYFADLEVGGQRLRRTLVYLN
jgi:hypothetical protein